MGAIIKGALLLVFMFILQSVIEITVDYLATQQMQITIYTNSLVNMFRIDDIISIYISTGLTKLMLRLVGGLK